MSKMIVESVDLSQITNRNAIVAVSHFEDGREKHFGIDIYSILGSYAYGAVLVTEEEGPGSKTYTVNRWISTRTARLPLQGTLEVGGEVTVDVAENVFPQGYPDEAALDAAVWEQVPVVCEALELVIRGE